MAEPKKRTNKSKGNMRRMHIKIATPTLEYCPNCHSAMKKHNLCSECGQYRGKKVVEKNI